MWSLIYLSLLIFPSLQIDQSKAIIIYFSRAGENYDVGRVDEGNTKMIVNYLEEVTDMQIYQIVPTTSYPEGYQDTLNAVQTERSSNARPSIKDPITDISKYDTILLGYPIWYTNLPNIVKTLLESLNLEGKTIYPFNTHEGSGVGNSISDIKSLAPNAIVKDGFPLKGSYARKTDSHKDIRDWLNDKLEIQVSKGEINKIDFFKKSMFLTLLAFLFL
jgi:flavodoxin